MAQIADSTPSRTNAKVMQSFSTIERMRVHTPSSDASMGTLSAVSFQSHRCGCVASFPFSVEGIGLRGPGKGWGVFFFLLVIRYGFEVRALSDSMEDAV